MSDPLVQELREGARFLETRHWRAPSNYECARLFTGAADALDAAHQREAALQEALENLVTKVDAMTVHPSFRSVWTLAYVHGHRYDGPTIDQEMNAAKALLAAGVRPQGEPR